MFEFVEESEALKNVSVITVRSREVTAGSCRCTAVRMALVASHAAVMSVVAGPSVSATDTSRVKT